MIAAGRGRTPRGSPSRSVRPEPSRCRTSRRTGSPGGPCRSHRPPVPRTARRARRRPRSWPPSASRSRGRSTWTGPCRRRRRRRAGRTAVGVDDDLPAGQPGVAHRAADLEPPGRVTSSRYRWFEPQPVEFGLDDVLGDVGGEQGLQRDVRRVLAGHRIVSQPDGARTGTPSQALSGDDAGARDPVPACDEAEPCRGGGFRTPSHNQDPTPQSGAGAGS